MFTANAKAGSETKMAEKRLTMAVDLPREKFQDLLDQYGVKVKLLTPGLYQFTLNKGDAEEFHQRLYAREDEILGPFLERIRKQQ